MLFSCFKRLCSISITFARDKLKAICPRLARASSLRPPKGVQDPFFHLLTRAEMDPELCWNRWDKTVTESGEKNLKQWLLGPGFLWFSGKDKIVIDSIDPTWYGLEDGAGHWLKSSGIRIYDPVARSQDNVRSSPSVTQCLSWDWRQFGVILQYLNVSDLLESSIAKLTLQYFALSVKPARKSVTWMAAAIESFKAVWLPYKKDRESQYWIWRGK